MAGGRSDIEIANEFPGAGMRMPVPGNPRAAGANALLTW